MDYLFDNWDRVSAGLEGKRLFICLDFDGTLVPLGGNPGKVFLSSSARDLLRASAKRFGVKLAVVSGRALKDLKNKIGLNDIIYVGNHGFEVEGPGIKFKSLLPAWYPAIARRIKKELAGKIARFPGAFLEDKAITLSLHYRQVDKKQIPGIKAMFRETLAAYLADGRVRVGAAKMAMEVVPPADWGKAKAVLWLLAGYNSGTGENKFYPVYFGDDVADEGVFNALKNKGLTVFVGRAKKSHAGYYVKNSDETITFLERIIREPYAGIS